MVYRFRVLWLIVWGLATVVSLAAVEGAFGSKLTDLLANRFDLPASESNTAREIMQHHFGERDDSVFTIVIRGPGAQAAAPGIVARGQAALPESMASVPQPIGNGIFVARIATRLPPDRAEPFLVPIRLAIGHPPGVEALVTGTAALDHDLTPTFNHDLLLGELVALPAAALVLLFIFGTLSAALVPIVLGLVTVPTTLGVIWLVAHEVTMAIYVQNLVSIIGIAIAIDYSLIIVYRFREELHRLDDVELALAETMRTAGQAVFFSGVTVAIGLALLLLMPVPFIRSIGVGGVMIPIISIAAALTLLPSLLGVLGHRIDRLRVLPASLLARREDPERGIWARLARLIMRRPLPIALATGGLLLLAAVPVPQLSLALGSSENLPGRSDSVRGAELLAHVLGKGATSPINVIVDHGPKDGVTALATGLARDPGVAQVAPPVADPSGRYVRITVLSRYDYGTDQAKQLVHRIRDHEIAAAGLPRERVYVGGAPAAGVDLIARAYGAFPWLVLGVLGITYLVLLRAFRSLLLPLKAVILNGLSIVATYGILVATFRWGIGRAVGLPQADQVEFWIPIFLFAMLFGLSMDYEVFLLSRMREIYDETGDNDTAIALGLEKTGRIITAAAAIMVAAFIGFVLGSLLGLQQFGWGLAVAVAVDATIIRVLLVPSLMKLMGDKNWYLPVWLEKLLRLPPLG